MSAREITEAQDQPGAARRALLTGGAVGLAAMAGTMLGGAQPANAVTQPSITDWINVVDAWGADNTGGTDSTTAINNAIAALPANGGVIYLPAGTYMIAGTINAVMNSTGNQGYGGAIDIRGSVHGGTQINFVGSGDCISMWNPNGPGAQFGTTHEQWAGGVHDILFEGSGASAGAVGLHIGDGWGYNLDRLFFQNFTKGGIGLHLDNRRSFTEKMQANCHFFNCDNSVIIDVNGGTTPLNTTTLSSLS